MGRFLAEGRRFIERKPNDFRQFKPDRIGKCELEFFRFGECLVIGDS